MNKYTVNKTPIGIEVVEKATMEVPIRRFFIEENGYTRRLELYKTHLANLKHYPCQPSNFLEDKVGQRVIEGVDFELKQKHCHHFSNVDIDFIAVPIKPKNEEVNWNDVIEKYKDETGSSVFATHTFGNWLKQNYKLTKK